MLVIETIDAVRREVAQWHAEGLRVALVPTMGNLHDGHLDLVARARRAADRVIVSIFVNPTQFGEGEDFEAYPRTLETDAEQLERAGTDVLFAPDEHEIYPRGREGISYVEVPGLSDILCGAFRPGHFRGVATIVAKLFNIVQPDVAVFGEKDLQQLVVVRRMVEELCMPVVVLGAPTVREADGLAMSSRNGYLDPEQRQRAPVLFRALEAVAAALRGGDNAYTVLEQEAMQQLAEAGFEPEYVSIRRARDLAPPEPGERHLAVLAAARLGRARLIDNIEIER